MEREKKEEKCLVRFKEALYNHRQRLHMTAPGIQPNEIEDRIAGANTCKILASSGASMDMSCQSFQFLWRELLIISGIFSLQCRIVINKQQQPHLCQLV